MTEHERKWFKLPGTDIRQTWSNVPDMRKRNGTAKSSSCTKCHHGLRHVVVMQSPYWTEHEVLYQSSEERSQQYVTSTFGNLNFCKYPEVSTRFLNIFRFSGTKYSTSILKLSLLLFTLRTGALDVSNLARFSDTRRDTAPTATKPEHRHLWHTVLWLQETRFV